MWCAFVRTHCTKVVITALALLVVFQYGFGVLYEEHRRLNEVYFTFNLTLPPLSSSVQQQSSRSNNLSNGADNYVPTPNMTLVALQSSNSSDPFQLDLLLESSNDTSINSSGTLNSIRKPSMCPLVSPLLGESKHVPSCITFISLWRARPLRH